MPTTINSPFQRPFCFNQFQKNQDGIKWLRYQLPPLPVIAQITCSSAKPYVTMQEVNFFHVLEDENLLEQYIQCF